MPFLLVTIFSFLILGCVSNGTHEKLQQKQEKTQSELEKSKTEIQSLEAIIAGLEKKLGKASSDRKTLSSSIEHMKTALREAAERKAEREKRIAEYKKLVQRFKSLTDAGELSIKIVDGRMVVALPSDVLFSSGSARLSAKGQETIKKVSQLLVNIEDKKFQVEGHTDNVPIRSAKYPSNWELASARALNVVKMMESSGMPPHRLSAASYGPNRPVQKNDTREGKQANRRIEVVVVPDLSALPGYDELKKMSDGQ